MGLAQGKAVSVEVSKPQSEVRQTARKASFLFFVKMSGTQKWGESILERCDINSTENGIGPGVDVLREHLVDTVTLEVGCTAADCSR